MLCIILSAFLTSIVTVEYRCPNVSLNCNLTECSSSECQYSVYVNNSNHINKCYTGTCYLSSSNITTSWKYLIINCNQINNTFGDKCLTNINEKSCHPKCLNTYIAITMTLLFICGVMWLLIMCSIYLCEHEVTNEYIPLVNSRRIPPNENL